jgi:2-methylcitrate dehydratase
MTPKLEHLLAEYAHSLDIRDIDDKVVHQAKRRIVDTVGGALAAYFSPPARIARRWALPVAGAEGARVWGSLVRTSPDMAAFANGTMLRYLDINDTYRTLDGSHPSDNLGGLFAMAEMLGRSGRDLVEAMIISYEIQSRFVDILPFNDNGRVQPVPGALACALACGRLLGLDLPALREAAALAVIPNLCTYQTRAGELSMWKGAAAANGARQGVFAALLSAEGMTGPSDPFDGVFGVWKQTLGKSYPLKPLARPGQTFAVQQSNIKKYPVRDSCQLPADTAQLLRREIAPQDIAELRIETYRSAYKGAVEDPELWAPQTRETADHSMLVAVCVTLVDGTISPETFNGERFKAPEVLDLIRRTKVDVVEEFTKAAPGIRNCRISATSRAGETRQAHLFWTSADIERGLSDAEIETKFENLNRDILPPRARRRLMDALWDIDNQPSVAAVVELTRI